jgi:hypothetical protein
VLVRPREFPESPSCLGPLSSGRVIRQERRTEAPAPGGIGYGRLVDRDRRGPIALDVLLGSQALLAHQHVFAGFDLDLQTGQLASDRAPLLDRVAWH